MTVIIVAIRLKNIQKIRKIVNSITREKDDVVNHNAAQKEYKNDHKRAGRVIVWELRNDLSLTI